MPKPTAYDRSFFADHLARADASARVVVPEILSLVPARRVVDVGCGVGAWLRVFAEHCVPQVHGFDGPWVDKSQLVIPESSFTHHDLARPIALDEPADLAVCLEVAEHLSPDAGTMLVESLTRLAPVVLFSAAIPGQGGTGHVNEQWPAFWASKFLEHDFWCVDVLRSRVWNSERIAWWYAQNTLIFASSEGFRRHPALAAARQSATWLPPALVHPECFLSRVNEPLGLARIVHGFPGALSRAVRARLGSGRGNPT